MEADKDNRPHAHHLHHRPTTATTTTTTSSNSSTTTGELFICFSTSRLSSSMKISSSKSILSPGRRRDQQPAQISLSTSLSRRLRTNGSIKGAGQASPMFPAGSGGKKRGCAFENPEPSSPKVTCIGQVRVKTKKQSRKLRARSLSARRPPPTPGGEGSFKRLERGISDGNVESVSEMRFQHECSQHRNQRWVHLPVTICEALRTFGSEFNCFLPCRSSSCLAGEEINKKEEKTAMAVSSGGSESNNGGSCGTVFARWLVAVQERDVKGREIELAAEQREKEDEEEEEDDVYSSPEMRRRSYRRHHGFEEIDFDLKQESFEGGGNNGREESRMSICIPPKNALLLMRCRSDPVKVAALGNKFWSPPDVVKDPDEAVEDHRRRGDGEEEENAAKHKEEEEGFVNEVAEVIEMEETIVESDELGTDSKCAEEAMAEAHSQFEEESAADEVSAQEHEEEAVAENEETPMLKQEEEEEEEEEVEEEESAAMSIADEGIPISDATREEEISDLENPSTEDNEEAMIVQSNEAGGEGTIMAEDSVSDSDSDPTMPEEEVAVTEEAAQEPEPPEQGAETPAVAAAEEEEEDKKGSEPENPESGSPSPSQTGQQKSKERENNCSNNAPLLPDCLLLMMCEPKLSMEVSKETWVCSTDFIRWLPEPSRQVAAVKRINAGDPPGSNNNNKTVSVDVIPEPVKMKTGGGSQHQPPRSSCSYPAAQPMAWRPGAESIGSGLETKLKGSKAYEYELPLMLTRCKSEPRRTAAKLAPEACCWKNRKLEPHRVRIGAAGVGF